MSLCPECYCENNRITPLLEPRNCLENHTQYICGTCGRCICIDKDEIRGVQRWNFPFKSLEIAKLYLRTADVSTATTCGIYELIDVNNRKTYKIFANIEDLSNYLLKNKRKSCKQMTPLFQQATFEPSPSSQIRKLTPQEVEIYLTEQTNMKRSNAI